MSRAIEEARDYLRPSKKLPTVWCAGCGLGIIMSAMIRAVARLGVEKNDVAVVSGIGCTGRLPTYVDFNTGHYTGDTYLDILEPYIRAIKKETGLLIGIQTPPHHDVSRYITLKEIGVNRVSFCFEIWDRERFVEVCPGKHREYGLDRYLEAVRYCAELGKKSGPFSFDPWVSNGEIVAGLEAPESSIEAVNWITDVGAVPTVCVFRPLKGTDYEDVPPPTTEEMVPVFARRFPAAAVLYIRPSSRRLPAMGKDSR